MIVFREDDEMTNECFLGIDLGAESGRVMAGLFNGETVELKQIRRFANEPIHSGDRMRWNIEALWGEIKQGLAAAAKEYGDSIVSAGVDTWGVDHVLLDSNDQPVTQPYHYRDSRTRGILDEAFNTVSRQEIFAQTGLQFMELNTLYQLIAMNRDEPDLLKQTNHLLMMPDYFHFLLSGEKASEFTEATTTQCYNPLKGDWAFELLQQFNLPTAMFGQIVQPGWNLGPMLKDVRNETGLGHIEIIAPASHDTGSAVAAVPARKSGSPTWAYISSGTWSLVGAEVNQAIMTDETLNLNFTNEGGVDGTYRLLKNIMGLWLVQQCKHVFEAKGDEFDYAQLAQAASKAEPFRSLVDPDDQRFLNPSDMTEAIISFCQETSQPAPETPGQFVRCALESLAFKYDQVLQAVEHLTGERIEAVNVVGGGCQNELLNQMTADACGKPVSAGPVEATALGNVLMQARAVGELQSLDDMRAVVRASSEMTEYEPQNQSQWSDVKGRFLNLLTT